MAGPRGGFTLIEVIVALVVLSVGLLGLVSTAALTTRLIAQGHRLAEAAALAGRRLEILRATPCGSMTGGSEEAGRSTVTWEVATTAGGRAREIALTVSAPTPAGFQTERFQAVVACRR